MPVKLEQNPNARKRREPTQGEIVARKQTTADVRMEASGHCCLCVTMYMLASDEEISET